MQRQRLLHLRLVGFSLVGGFVFLLGMALLALQVELLHIDKYIAGATTTAISLQINFLLNKYLNWRERKGALGTQWLRFHATRLGMALANQALYSLLVFLGINYLVATILCTALSTAVNYIGSDKFVFKN